MGDRVVNKKASVVYRLVLKYFDCLTAKEVRRQRGGIEPESRFHLLSLE